MTAAGQADIFASLRPMNEWDICAGLCLINESGGKLVTSSGEQITYNNIDTLITPGLIAGNNRVVDDKIQLIKKTN